MCSTNTLSLLFIDDDIDLVQYWMGKLESSFRKIYMAGHGHEGLEAMHRDRPDIVFVDTQLPKMDGFAFCEELKRHNDFDCTPVVLYKSGYLSVADRRSAVDSGAEHIVSKPTSADQIIEIIKEVYAEKRINDYINTDEIKVSTKEEEYLQDDVFSLRLTKKLNQLETQRQALELAVNRFQSFASCVADYFWETNADHQLKFLGSSGKSSLSMPVDDFENKKFCDFFSPCFTVDDISAINEKLLLKLKIDLDCKLRGKKCNGVVRVLGRPFYSREGHFLGFRGVIIDITDSSIYSEQLHFAAHHDILTGLKNLRAFEDGLKNSLKRMQEGEQHVLCFLDLDYFKVVNDTAGHRAGDELLKLLSQLFRSKVRGNDILARVGGDEFAILLKHCHLDHARRLIMDLHNSVKTFRFHWDKKEFEVGLSIGLVEITSPDFPMQELIEFADQACYSAKKSGRNQIQIFGAKSQHNKLVGDATWLEKFHQAINNDDLCLYKQPIKRITGSGMSYSYEILVRMRDSSRLASPKQFLTVIERYQLTTLLDKWVINHVIDWLENDPQAVYSVDFFSINVSSASICDPDFRTHVSNHFRDKPQIASKICFEVTESAAMENFENAIEFFTNMRSHGCRFALDDFGTGFSSLAYLKQLPVDFVKLDGMYVKGVTSDRVDHGMVQSIQHIASLMGIKTIAEYVESREIEEVLREIGVDYLQGFHIGYPEMVVATENALNTGLRGCRIKAS